MSQLSRLLVFTENYARGGGNRYMIDLVNSIEDCYDEVILTSNSNGIYPEDVHRLKRPVDPRHAIFITRALIGNFLHFIPLSVRRMILVPFALVEPFFFLGNVIAFVLLIWKVRPSYVISCNGGYPGAASLAIVVAAKFLRVPVALSIVSMPASRRRFLRLYEKLIDKLVWQSAEVVVVNAKAIAHALHELRGMPLDRAEVIYNGLEDIPASISSKAHDKGYFVIGCIARMDAWKGVLFLFDAFAYLAKRHPELRLVLAGQGDASEELFRRTQALGLQDRVQLLGHYTGDVCALLDTFDIYIFPSLWEGFPYSIVESMRSGCTIVATSVGGIPEAITDGVEGVLIKPASADAITEAIERLLSDPATCQVFARNARLKFERDLVLQKMHSRVKEVLIFNRPLTMNSGLK